MKRLLSSLFLLSALGGGLSACAAKQPPPPPPSASDVSRMVFDAVSPSVVAILNDDRAEREEETKELLKSFGDESKAPKKVVDVSLRKEPTPHGTGFMIEGGNIITAAHVVMRPDKLKITTHDGQTVEAELVRLDEFRDVAVLKPKEPLKGVVPIRIEDGDIKVGEQVWAMGHTGQGLWALSWGISEGVASGVVDLMGVKLLLFDAKVYPGFSGGPVLALGKDGKPSVVGVNHAILFLGGSMFMGPVASISSGVNVSEIREAVAGRPHPMEQKLAAYAKEQNDKQFADLFITNGLSVHRDAQGRQVAEIYGNAKALEAGTDGAFIPVVAMLFRLPHGQQEITFELHDPNGQLVSTSSKTVGVAEHQRVAFASAGFRFDAKQNGRYEVIAKLAGKTLGSSTVALSVPNDDNELVDTHDSDVSENGDPDVDIVVAQFGSDQPLSLSGISSAWAEKSYPRRVGFTWFARGTRGWSGTNVAVNAYVLDPDGHVVGSSLGCFRPELRPEMPWSCMGTGGSPLTMKEGDYDVVFTINDRPVAMWPMEAAIRSESAPGSDIGRWLKDMQKRGVRHTTPKAKPEAAPTPPPPPPVDPKAKPAPKPPATPPKPKK